jgi:2-polyprenyl-6-methoxyphenol hydroxylase-like FAD-dependent oxidoreductase
MEGASDIYLDRVSQIEMPAWSNGRTVLVGDAASCVSLLAGEGTGLAMVHAYILAAELRAAKGDVRRACEGYEKRLRPLMATKQKAARRFAGFFAPQSRLGIALRNLTMRAMNIGFVADALVGRSLRDDVILPVL